MAGPLVASFDVSGTIVPGTTSVRGHSNHASMYPNYTRGTN